jgi:DNA processing protein
VLVIEADERSGALITARQAADEHNRVVMAIPGRVDNPQSAGPHKLIRQGATLVTRIEHILEAVGSLDASIPEMPLFEQPEAEATAPPPAKVPSSLSSEQQQIVDVLGVDPQDVDAISERSGLEVSIVMRELTMLTLKGRARRVDGQRYARVG